jgi:hypothetical protein
MNALAPATSPPPGRDRAAWAFPLGLAAVACGMIGAAHVMSSSWERVRTKPPDRSIEVTGSAKRRITSDLAEWSASITTEDADRTAAYRLLHTQVDATLAFLKSKGVKDAEIRVSSASFGELTETEVTETKERRTEKTKLVGHRTTQSITITSGDVALVERMSREVTQLLEQGITVTSQAPAYFYTRLGEVKIEMLAEASKDARTRADNMIRSAGGATLGKLRTADMGVINVNPANSTSTAWDGNNDTTSLDKDIITIVHTTYELR